MEDGDLLLKTTHLILVWYCLSGNASFALLNFVTTVLPCPFCLAPSGAEAKL